MKKFLIILSCISFIFGITFSLGVPAYAKDEKGPMSKTEQHLENYVSRSAYLIDYDTETVLYERNPDAKYPIASMVKIMTLNIIFEEIEKGNLSFEEMITISERAAGMGGSQMFLDTGLQYSVNDLIKGVIVVSANDASVALAERAAGSVETFIDHMNNKAKEYGMENTAFVNVTGLPQEGQFSTARDVSKMMKNLLKHPEYYQFSSVYLENYNHPDGRVTELTNTNKLVRFYDGCDGGKTGFTNDALFCLSATAKRGDTRVIATVLGAPTGKDRNKEITDLFNYGFHNYHTVKLIEKDKPIACEVNVKGAKNRIFSFASKDDIAILERRGKKNNYEVKIEVNDDLKAPIKQGEAVGRAVVLNDQGAVIKETQIVTLTDIEARSYLDGLRKILENWSLSV